MTVRVFWPLPVLICLLCACDGPVGLAGPAGPQGIADEKGDSGSVDIS